MSVVLGVFIIISFVMGVVTSCIAFHFGMKAMDKYPEKPVKKPRAKRETKSAKVEAYNIEV